MAEIVFVFLGAWASNVTGESGVIEVSGSHHLRGDWPLDGPHLGQASRRSITRPTARVEFGRFFSLLPGEGVKQLLHRGS